MFSAHSSRNTYCIIHWSYRGLRRTTHTSSAGGTKQTREHACTEKRMHISQTESSLASFDVYRTWEHVIMALAHSRLTYRRRVSVLKSGPTRSRQVNQNTMVGSGSVEGNANWSTRQKAALSFFSQRYPKVHTREHKVWNGNSAICL